MLKCASGSEKPYVIQPLDQCLCWLTNSQRGYHFPSSQYFGYWHVNTDVVLLTFTASIYMLLLCKTLVDINGLEKKHLCCLLSLADHGTYMWFCICSSVIICIVRGIFSDSRILNVIILYRVNRSNYVLKPQPL